VLMSSAHTSAASAAAFEALPVMAR
jgi:hypothetical protein